MTKKPEEEGKAKMGRPPLPEAERTVNGSIRLTPARWVKLRRLGNAWLSRKIDQAKEPEPEE